MTMELTQMTEGFAPYPHHRASVPPAAAPAEPSNAELEARATPGNKRNQPLTDLPFGFPAMLSALKFVGYGIVELFTLLWLVLVVLLSCIGIGLPLLQNAFSAIHANAQRQRRAAWSDSGVPVSANYLPFPDGKGPFGLATLGRRLTDPTVLKDLAWHLINPAIGTAIGALPLVMIAQGLFGIVLMVFQGPLGDVMQGSWYAFFPLGGSLSFFLAGALGAVWLVAAPFAARPLLRLHGLWVRWVLSTDQTDQLRERVAKLQETRTTALDMQQAEIQRIERDLHDGAQARLVAMGMTITQATRLIESDPERAVALLNHAKEDSASALQELRDLVRGIRPPVLADRGLSDALRALAASSPVHTEVRSALDHRLSPPLESALYFAVAELITNATKHAQANHISVELSAGGGLVRATVTDDGIGGADSAPNPGGGIDGVRRRLQPFDGELVITSPAGGPTVAVIKAPDAAA